MSDIEYKIIFTDFNSVSILVDKDVIKHSQKLTDLFGSKLEIKLSGVDPQIFSHILTYIKHISVDQHDGEQFAKTLISNMSFDILINVVRTADFLNIQSLVDIASKFFKKLLNKDPEHIKKLYNL